MMPKSNNFDLIRLAAALQVALAHSLSYMDASGWARLFITVTSVFPGVPIFFFISGFLISKSYENNARLSEYARNRVLRIYPGLSVCFLVSIASVATSGYFAIVNATVVQWVGWVLAQLTFLQFYNPQFMRHYGVGVLNGSMWTITVELQFYVLLPVMYALLRFRKLSKRQSNCALSALILIFVFVNELFVGGGPKYASTSWYKLVGVSFLPWIYMFLVGVIYQRNSDVISRWLAGRFFAVLVGYCLLGFVGRYWLEWSGGNALGPQLFVLLAAVVFAAAFSCITLSEQLLRRNDISYGVYIYHMPVVNCIVAMGFVNAGSVHVAIAATIALAFASWRWVEKPALAFKKHALYEHSASRI